MIVANLLYFSALSIRLHEAHRTHKSDLGQMDQAIWNTSQGRFVQETRRGEVLTRLTDHVEPIFAPVSLIFWAWDDVRGLLILQAVAISLGAWPAFHLACARLGRRQKCKNASGPPVKSGHAPSASSGAHRARRWSDLTALAFALAYLLYPPLQAAVVADFHALPLATPLILLAFLFAERQQWGRFAIAALLVGAVQEGTALLTAGLGILALFQGGRQLVQRRRHASAVRPAPALAAGSVVLAAGLAWFYLATFVIIPAYAAGVYGSGETPYAARFGALGDSFGDVLRSLVTRPGLVLQVTLEPLRVGYILRLLAPLGFLSLAGIDILLLALPLLLANLLSSFAFQYSGQLHYSAPLAAYAVTAAIVGSDRLRPLARRLILAARQRRLWRAHRSYLPLLIWLLAWSIGCQIAFGYTPIGGQFRYYWPEVTPHHQLLERFARQIPAAAPLSTMAALYPHFSHRQYIHQFPILANAQYVLLDIAADSGWSSHPVVVRDQVTQMLDSGEWIVQDAADGYLLLARQAEPAPTNSRLSSGSLLDHLPEAFYQFAQAQTQPQIPLDITFDGRLKLIGYDVVENAQWRQVGFRLYWQALAPLPGDTQVRVFTLTPSGEEIDANDDQPLIQPLWYPPSAWPVGDVVITERLPWFLPAQWALAAGVYQGDAWDDLNNRWRVADQTSADAAVTMTFEDRTWVRLDAWQWQHGELITPPAPPEFQPFDATFGGDGWTVELTGVSEPKRSAPGQSALLTLRWQADAPAPRDYTVFVHLRDSSGQTLAQADATPHWYGPLPTSRWPAGPGDTPILDAHTLSLPDTLPPGTYDIVVGWYYWETQERLALLDENGMPIDDGAIVGQIEVDSTARPAPDLACALAPEACASQ
jgi:uncharacterized membrane protein